MRTSGELLRWRQSRVLRVAISGEIRGTAMAEVLSLVEEQRALRVVLDLGEVTHLDYRAVRPLAQAARTARELGGDIKLAGVSAYVWTIIRSAGAYDAFECFVTSDEAERAFEGALCLAG